MWGVLLILVGPVRASASVCERLRALTCSLDTMSTLARHTNNLKSYVQGLRYDGNDVSDGCSDEDVTFEILPMSKSMTGKIKQMKARARAQAQARRRKTKSASMTKNHKSKTSLAHGALSTTASKPKPKPKSKSKRKRASRSRSTRLFAKIGTKPMPSKQKCIVSMEGSLLSALQLPSRAFNQTLCSGPLACVMLNEDARGDAALMVPVDVDPSNVYKHLKGACAPKKAASEATSAPRKQDEQPSVAHDSHLLEVAAEHESAKDEPETLMQFPGNHFHAFDALAKACGVDIHEVYGTDVTEELRPNPVLGTGLPVAVHIDHVCVSAVEDKHKVLGLGKTREEWVKISPKLHSLRANMWAVVFDKLRLDETITGMKHRMLTDSSLFNIIHLVESHDFTRCKKPSHRVRNGMKGWMLALVANFVKHFPFSSIPVFKSVFYGQPNTSWMAFQRLMVRCKDPEFASIGKFAVLDMRTCDPSEAVAIEERIRELKRRVLKYPKTQRWFTHNDVFFVLNRMSKIAELCNISSSVGAGVKWGQFLRKGKEASSKLHERGRLGNDARIVNSTHYFNVKILGVCHEDGTFIRLKTNGVMDTFRVGHWVNMQMFQFILNVSRAYNTGQITKDRMGMVFYLSNCPGAQRGACPTVQMNMGSPKGGINFMLCHSRGAIRLMGMCRSLKEAAAAILRAQDMLLRVGIAIVLDTERKDGVHIKNLDESGNMTAEGVKNSIYAQMDRLTRQKTLVEIEAGELGVDTGSTGTKTTSRVGIRKIAKHISSVEELDNVLKRAIKDTSDKSFGVVDVPPMSVERSRLPQNVWNQRVAAAVDCKSLILWTRRAVAIDLRRRMREGERGLEHIFNRYLVVVWKNELGEVTEEDEINAMGLSKRVVYASSEDKNNAQLRFLAYPNGMVPRGRVQFVYTVNITSKGKASIPGKLRMAEVAFAYSQVMGLYQERFMDDPVEVNMVKPEEIDTKSVVAFLNKHHDHDMLAGVEFERTEQGRAMCDLLDRFFPVTAIPAEELLSVFDGHAIVPPPVRALRLAQGNHES